MPIKTSPFSRRDALRGLGIAAIPLLVGGVPAALAQPAATRLKGVIRVCGSPQMGGMMAAWVKAFGRIEPGVLFDIDLKGTSTGQFALQQGTADIALSARQASDYEQYGIYRRSVLLTTEIEVATGSHNEIGKSAALAVFVHPDNPVAGLSVEQLDRIFGAERAGGWGTMVWNESAARGPETNIRSWGQLGLTGEWANAKIIPYGPPAAHPGGRSFFQARVMGGADTYNEETREYADRRAMLADLAKDRFGIAYASLGYARPGVRTIPIADGNGRSWVALTRKTVADRSYPLSRPAYVYLSPNDPAGDAVEVAPHIRRFLEFVLSTQGQRLVTATGFNPLTAAVASAQGAKLIGKPQVYRVDE